MKQLTIILFLIFVNLGVFGRKIYFSNSGNDGNSGLSTGTPKATLAAANGFSYASNDTIAFECGGIWYGSLIINRNTITVTSYGSGAKPMITGFTNLSGWTAAGGNTWNATPAVMPKRRVNLVTKNGAPIEVGKYPNGTTYNTYESHSGTTSITDNQLSGTPNYTNADMAWKCDGYVLFSGVITNHSGTTLTYGTIPTINPRNAAASFTAPKQDGFGYQIYRSASTLDIQDEWFMDSVNSKFILYSTSTPSAIYRVSTVDTLLNIGTFTNITVDGIQFEGAGMAAIFFRDASNITIKNVDILNSGAKGIFGWATPNVLIQDCNVNWCLCGGIDVTGRYVGNVTYRRCVVRNTANFITLGNRFDEADMCAYMISVSSGALVEYCASYNCGYNGFRFQGNDVTLQYNLSDTACYVKDDGGNFYSYGGGPYPIYNTNTTILRYNIGLHSLGSAAGNALPTHGENFYLDGGRRGVKLIGNTAAYGGGNGFYINDPKDVLMDSNTTYSNGANRSTNGSGAWGGQKHCVDSVFRDTLRNNLFYSTASYQNSGYYFNYGLNGTGTPIAASQNAAISAWAVIDYNYYNTTNSTPFYNGNENPCGGSYTAPSGRSFSSWQALQDAHSVATTYTSQTFEYTTGTSKTVNFAGLSKKDLRGNVYNNSVTLSPYTSIILIDNGTVTQTTNFNTVRLRIVN